MMKKVQIIYESHTGITKYYAEEIGKYLQANNISVTVASIHDYNSGQLGDSDAVMLGCWTSGLFIVAQRPNKDWISFAEKLPDLHAKKVILFTTYKLATGSMFRKMKKKLSGKIERIELELKSKTGSLSENDKTLLSNILM